MKIAYIIPSCSVSGGMAVICQHGNRLAKRGHSVVFLAIGDIQLMDWFPSQKIDVHHAAIWDGELDVLVATSWATAFWLPRIKAKTKYYFVQSDETRFHPNNSRWQHLTALTYFFGVHYLTEAVWIQKWLKASFGHDAELIPNGLDAEIFFPVEPLTPKGNKVRILLEGAINLPYKGMHEAFAAVQNIDAEIWCVSSYGTPKPEWKCDRFFEQVPMQEMKKIYSSCDILLKLSRVEGFFGPPMEMMACGGAVVVGRVTGYDEYIVENKNALVVEAQDTKAAEYALRELIEKPELRKNLILNGYQTAREWNWDQSIEKLERFYSRISSNVQFSYEKNGSAKYDLSLSYFNDLVSSGVFPDDITSRSSRPVPQHVLRLATHLANSKVFEWFADAIRVVYRAFKFLRKKL
jgi:O-antigen biosynthesis protein